MRILKLIYYFTPELSPGAFRNQMLVNELIETIPQTSTIEVLCSAPNRHSLFRQSAAQFEKNNNLKIVRFWVPFISKSKTLQFLNFIFFAVQCLIYARNRKYDLVYASTSMLMTACLASIFCKIKSAKKIIDVRDIFLDTIHCKLSKNYCIPIIFILKKIERFAFRKSNLITLTSPAFLEYFESEYPDLTCKVFTNGLDPFFLSNSHIRGKKEKTIKKKNDKQRIVYAGNIGEGQALEQILPQLAKRTEKEFEYIIYGDGTNRKKLEKQIKDANIKNIALYGPVGRNHLIEIYNSADILFLHLNKIDAFKRVLPSKIFEYASSGKPILAGVEGFPATFIEMNIDNAKCFEPLSPDHAIKALKQLKLKRVFRQKFINNFQRKKIMKEFAENIVLSIRT